MPSSLRSSLVVGFFALSTLAQPNPSGVRWISPSKGSNFVAGDSATLEWENLGALANPSILLCYSSLGEGSRKQECAPETYPKEANFAGVHTLEVVLPSVLSQDTYVFIIGDGQGVLSYSAPFSIRPASVPLIKASDILPIPTAKPAANQDIPSATPKPTPNASRPNNNIIGYAVAGVIGGIALILLAIFALWRRKQRKAASKPADPEANNVNLSRAPSSASLSSLQKPVDDVVDDEQKDNRYSEVITNLSDKPIPPASERTQSSPSSFSPFRMIRDFSKPGKERITNVRNWLPPIPRVWSFFWEDHPEKEGHPQFEKTSPETHTWSSHHSTSESSTTYMAPSPSSSATVEDKAGPSTDPNQPQKREHEEV